VFTAAELATLTTEGVDRKAREASVFGKGGKQRTVKFTWDTFRAIDRYVRERAAHRMADRSRCRGRLAATNTAA
jgi:site-specific recombinase XerD